MPDGNGTHDKPGSYRVLDLNNLTAEKKRAELDKAENDGYVNLLAIDQNFAYLYREEKKH